KQVWQQRLCDSAIIISRSGIYGRERLMRLRKAREEQKEPVAAEHWSNRIMDRDLVTIIENVMTIGTPKPLYIATDYAPVTTFELSTWLSEQIDAKPPAMDNSKTDRKSTRLNSSHVSISYAVFCLKKKNEERSKLTFNT